MGFAGAYRVQVVDASTKEVVQDHGWNKNMITNTGMDYIASNNLGNLSYYACIGTGNRPNCLDFTYTGIAQSGSTIGLVAVGEIGSFTATTASYTAVQVGDEIYDQDFSMSTVLAVAPTLLTVDSNNYYTDPKAFSVWKVSQTKLQAEIHRTSNFYPGSSSAVGFNCGTIFSGSTMFYRRTWDFPTETQTQSINEVGVSPSSTANGNVFSRVLLPYTITLSPGQLMRLTYELTCSYNNVTASFGTASITQWPVAPSTTTYYTASVQNWLVSYVTTSGGTSIWSTYQASLEPAVGGPDYGNYGTNGCAFFGSENSESVANFPNAVTRNQNVAITNNATPEAYTAGTYTRTKVGTFDIYSLNSSNIRSLGFGCYQQYQYGNLSQPYNNGSQGYVMVFDQPQTKLNTQTLTLRWRWNWGRVLPTSSVLSYSLMPPPPPVACGGPSTYFGGRNMPTQYDVALGATQGPVSVSYQVYKNPDRIQVWFDGTLRYDTGYLGQSGSTATDNLYKNLRDAGLVFYGSGSETSSPIINNGIKYPGDVTGSFMWNKDSATATASVHVFGPGDGTEWIVTMGCPGV